MPEYHTALGRDKNGEVYWIGYGGMHPKTVWSEAGKEAVLLDCDIKHWKEALEVIYWADYRDFRQVPGAKREDSNSEFHKFSKLAKVEESGTGGTVTIGDRKFKFYVENTR